MYIKWIISRDTNVLSNLHMMSGWADKGEWTNAKIVKQVKDKFIEVGGILLFGKDNSY